MKTAALTFASILLLLGALSSANSADAPCESRVVRVTLFGVGSIEKTLSFPSELIKGQSQSVPCKSALRVERLTIRLPKEQLLAPDSGAGDTVVVALQVGLPDGIDRYVAYMKTVGVIKHEETDTSTGLHYAKDLAPLKDPFIAVHMYYSVSERLVIRCKEYLVKPIQEPRCVFWVLEGETSIRVEPLRWPDRTKWKSIKQALVAFVKKAQE